MVYAPTYATSGSCLLKAGANVSSAFYSGQTTNGNPDINTADEMWNMLIRQAESEINVSTRKNWTDVYSTLNDDLKYILEEAASNLAAIYAINWDSSGFTQLSEAQNMLNVLDDGYNRCIKILIEEKNKDKIS